MGKPEMGSGFAGRLVVDLNLNPGKGWENDGEEEERDGPVDVHVHECFGRYKGYHCSADGNGARGQATARRSEPLPASNIKGHSSS